MENARMEGIGMILTENWRIALRAYRRLILFRWAFVSSLCPATTVNRQATLRGTKSAQAD
jgi:hypothetical protein